jgi:hypothetical protein
MLVDALWLAAGLVVIVKGGDLFVSASVRIAELLRLPRIVIGSTLRVPLGVMLALAAALFALTLDLHLSRAQGVALLDRVLRL